MPAYLADLFSKIPLDCCLPNFLFRVAALSNNFVLIFVLLSRVFRAYPKNTSWNAFLYTPSVRRCRNQHSMAFQTPIANTDVYKGSFFPQTIRDWNALPDSLISSAEDAEDCIAKFTSLVRARD